MYVLQHLKLSNKKDSRWNVSRCPAATNIVDERGSPVGALLRKKRMPAGVVSA